MEDFSNQEQEEARFYFALHEFRDIVLRYGAKTVLEKMDKETEEKLYWFYFSQLRREDE